MRLDSLRHLAVIDPETACRAGTVIDYWVDPTIGRVAALSMRPVDIDQPQRISCTRVARVALDAMMLTRGSGPTSGHRRAAREGRCGAHRLANARTPELRTCGSVLARVVSWTAARLGRSSGMVRPRRTDSPNGRAGETAPYWAGGWQLRIGGCGRGESGRCSITQWISRGRRIAGLPLKSHGLISMPDLALVLALFVGVIATLAIPAARGIRR